MSGAVYSRRPRYPRAGDVLEYIGGPRDGELCEMRGAGKEILVYLDTPQPIEAAAIYEPTSFTRRMGVYEVSLYGRGHGKGKPVDWFYALKWIGER